MLFIQLKIAITLPNSCECLTLTFVISWKNSPKIKKTCSVNKEPNLVRFDDVLLGYCLNRLTYMSLNDSTLFLRNPDVFKDTSWCIFLTLNEVPWRSTKVQEALCGPWPSRGIIYCDFIYTFWVRCSKSEVMDNYHF